MKYLLAVLLCLFSLFTQAETPITLVVGFAPGGSADTSARILAKSLSETLNTTVIVDNKVGAGGVIAHKYVASAQPNGTTILFSSIGPLTASYFNGIEPLATVVQFPHVFAVPPSLGVTTLKEFIALAKKKNLSYASTGVDSIPHAQGRILAEKAGIELTHVPYKGGSLAVIDVVAGRVDGFFAGLTVVEPYIKAGKLVPLAVSSGSRFEFIPDVPTVTEQGIAGYDMPNAYVLALPSNTPKNIVKALNKAVNKSLSNPETVASLQSHGFSPLVMDTQATKRFVDKNLVIYSAKNSTKE